MKQLIIAVIVCLLFCSFASCEVNTQDWRAKGTKTGTIFILDNVERGYKAGDTMMVGAARFVLLEVVSK